MADTCRIPGCTAPPTHVLLTHAYTWHREAMRATDAPQVCLNTIVYRSDPAPLLYGPPVPYYCPLHAEERSYA